MHQDFSIPPVTAALSPLAYPPPASSEANLTYICQFGNQAPGVLHRVHGKRPERTHPADHHHGLIPTSRSRQKGVMNRHLPYAVSRPGIDGT